MPAGQRSFAPGSRHRNWPLPGGETLATVLARGVDVLQFILKHRGQTMVLVGHDSTNRIILLHALCLPLSRCWGIKE